VNDVEEDDEEVDIAGPGRSAPVRRIINCKQINLHASVAPQGNLVQVLSCLRGDYLVFMHEPYTFRGKITGCSGIPLHYYQSKDNVPRAAIATSLPMWLMTDFATPDLAPCCFLTGVASCPEIVVASVYCDIKKNCFSPELKRLLQYCKDTLRPLVLGVDTNAHSHLWGCATNNARGDIMEEHIFAHGLTIHNVGNQPTFASKIGKSIIDVTMSMNIGDEEVQLSHWRIDPRASLSDHRCLEFQLSLGERPPVTGRCILRADWGIFRSKLEASIWNQPKLWSWDVIEEEALSFQTEVEEALEAACPTKIIKPKKINVYWWSDKLAHLRRECRKAERKKRLFPTAERWDSYVAARRLFKKQLRWEKKNSWQLFCSDTKDPAAMAKLNKIVQQAESRTLGMLKKPDGGHTRTPEETVSLLLGTHFPGCLVPRADVKNSALQVVADLPFVTPDRVKAAIDLFGAHKSSGLDGFKPCTLQNMPRNMFLRLACLYQACIQLGYTPKSWRTSKVVFLPKPDKEDYAQAKAFRPISLMSFVFKAMERVILWHLETTALRVNPINSNQHAFR
jgi:hypothetical protein